MPFRVQYFTRLFIFWIALFTSFRLLFLAFNPQEVFHASILTVLKSLVCGLRLDLSTIAYLTLPSFFFWLLQVWSKKNIFAKLNLGYHDIILFGLTALYVGTIKMYHDWNTLLTYSIFDYLKNPKEVASFISFWELAGLFMAYFTYFFFAVYIFKKKVHPFFSKPPSLVKKIALSLGLPVLLVIMARGGLQLTPVNESSAYFSENIYFNQVAINPFWYFVHSFLNKAPDKNPYLFMEDQVATARNQKLYKEIDSLTPDILNTTRPNLVIIILESWTADIVKSLGGEVDVTPQFDSLQKEGLLFTQIYAAGSRTEHGLTSILNGFPPPPFISIITIPEKSQKLTSLNTPLMQEGYASSFYYGGEIEFANMKSLLLNAHFQNIIDKHAFAEKQLNGKWGAHDEFVFEKQLLDLHGQQQPFFSVLLTLSSHEPFEVPISTPFRDQNISNKFRSAAWYSDHCLGQYFAKAKQQPWYANTLFILVADHGHRLPKHLNTSLPRSKHIPLLFYGPALKEEWRGKKINTTGNQNDIASTLLHQMHLSSSGFPRSKNLLNPTALPFAYYVNSSVMGWITPQQSLIYTFATKENKVVSVPSKVSANTDSLLMDAKAYLQTHFQFYLDL